MTVGGFLGRALQDPATGLPNVPYFKLIQDWEERRASRRHYLVRVIRLTLAGGTDRLRRLLSWRLCQELRSSDLIASNGREHFRILLTSPDAEKAEAIAGRIDEIVAGLNETEPDGPAITLAIEIESAAVGKDARGPCEPCRDDVTEDSGEGQALDAAPNLPPASEPER